MRAIPPVVRKVSDFRSHRNRAHVAWPRPPLPHRRGSEGADSSRRKPKWNVVPVLGAVLVTGCGNLSAVLNAVVPGRNTITLRLVNETSFAVKPSVYVSSVQSELLFESITEEALTIGANLQDFDDLAPRAELTQEFECDEFGAVMAKGAELRTGVGLSPDSDSAVFVEGRDFECGDTVTVLYGGGLTNFSARISSAPFDAGGVLGALIGR